MELSLIIWMLFVHWIADFVFQSDKMAINKSKSIIHLLNHSTLYFVTLIFGLFLYEIIISQVELSLIYFNINWISHFIIDGITSKINAKLYEKNLRHWFFVSIGFDQFLHLSILILTLKIT